MQKLQSIIILACLAFINFPRGCEAHKCLLFERLKCHGEYSRAIFSTHTHGRFSTQTHSDAHICSAAEDYLKCVEDILADCRANPHVANVDHVTNQAKYTAKQMKIVKEQHRCGACEKKHSLIVITLGLLYYFLTLKS